MPKLIRRRSKKLGLPPGTLVFLGEKKLEKSRISIIDYDEKKFEEKTVETIEECFPFKDKPTVTWINIDGIHDVDIIEKLGKQFDLHPLLLEDIVNAEQRPKVDDYGNHLFIVMKMFQYDEKNDELIVEQVSMILGENFVISFQERIGDVFDFVRNRIRNSKGPVRKMSADYLAYALVDAIVDSYFVILEKIGEEIESREAELVTNPTPETLQTIYRLKTNLAHLRKSIWPLREVVSILERGGSALIKKKTVLYLRDVYDHTIQVIDTIETSRDITSGMLDIYLSSVSIKMNEVMKVLTIIATIFIPLTFIVGVYGMNFAYMPELQINWAYPMIWIIMIAIGILMILYFRKRRWL